MATIRKWLMQDHRHPLDSRIVVSREIHMEGEFSDEEWFAIQAMFVGMRKAGFARALHPGKPAIEAEVIDVP